MRKNQVSIYVRRFFSEAPEGAVSQDISVYADANNIWEALVAANHELTRRILQDQPLPKFGRAESSSVSKVYRNGEDRFADVTDSVTEKRWKLKEKAFEEQKKALEEVAKKYEDIKEPNLHQGTWVVHSPEEKVEYGDAEYVAAKWTNAMICYRYKGYDDTNTYRNCARAYCFNDVVEKMLRAPEKTEVDEYEEDYSEQELRLLEEIKRKLTGCVRRRSWLFIDSFYSVNAYIDLEDKNILGFYAKENNVYLVFDMSKGVFVEEDEGNPNSRYYKHTIIDWCEYHKSRIQDMISNQSYTELQRHKSDWFKD